MAQSPFAACLVAALVAFSSIPALADQTVTLGFGWSPGAAVDVTFEGRRLRTVGDRRRESSMTGSYSISASAVEDGLRLDYEDFDVRIGASALPEGLQRDLQHMVLQAAMSTPDYVVGDDGAIRRFVGTDALIGSMREAYRSIEERLPEDVRPRFRKTMAAVLRPAVIERRLRDEWGLVVAVWSGAELSRGRVYSLESTENVAALGNASLPMHVTFEYRGTAPCVDGGAPECVELHMVSRVDAVGAAPVIERLAKKMSARGTGEFEIKAVDVTTSVDLVTEPASLRPHRASVARTIAVTIARDGVDRVSRQSQQQDYHYTWR